ncbi:MAG: AMP-binding protein, partial [Deltaproteobacteria bacterium]|nr:AMP-binding protein [Deltaproteobacteria bacterium]
MSLTSEPLDPKGKVGSTLAGPPSPSASRDAGSIIAMLARNAAQWPNRLAMREKDLGIWEEYTWADYLHEVLSFAAGMESLGFGALDAMLILGDNRSQLYFGMLGVSALRGFPTPVFPDAAVREMLPIARDSGARFALAEDQEQVDKLIDLRRELGGLPHIVYEDPRGLSAYEESGLISYKEVRERGERRLREEPGLGKSLVDRAGPEDFTIFLHSSGTTGEPKAIVLKHRHLLATVRIGREGDFFQEGEEIVAYLPMAWVGDFAYTVAGGISLHFTVNIPERQETVWHDFREIAPTLIFAPPRMWENMLTGIQVRIENSSRLKRGLYSFAIRKAMEVERARLEGKRVSLFKQLARAFGEITIYSPIKDHLGLVRVRRAYTGGEAIGEDTFLFFRAIGVNLKQGYGLTEACAVSVMQSDGEVRLHTVGKPLPGVRVRINDEGEILLNAENVFDGYHNNPEATKKVLKDGWFHTGDAGYFEEGGQLVVLGRISEVQYTAKGERYVPNYIENRLKFSPFIKDAAVLGAGRDYLAAIICIDKEAAGDWAEIRGIPYTSYADLCQKPEVYGLIREAIQHVNGLLPEGLRIRRFVNLHKEFDPDDGELTRTRKLRRNVVEERYCRIIVAIYEGDKTVDMEAQITYETGDVGVIQR